MVVWAATTIGAVDRVSIRSDHPVPAREKEQTAVTDATPTTEVVHNPEKKRYEIFADGDLAGFTEYEERDDVTDFVHTEIDGAFAGKGLGGVLARGALDDVIARERVIFAHCPFIRKYLDKHPEYDAHVLGKGIVR